MNVGHGIHSIWSDRLCVRRAWRDRRAFTLIELILVMAILTIAVSVTAPALANFFHGRSLDSEARRLLSLTREGQSRAISEGVPMQLWVDSNQGAYGLEAEPSFEPTDNKASNFPVDKDTKLEVANLSSGLGLADVNPLTGEASRLTLPGSHSNLPHIRFLPDGSVSDTSPQILRLTGRDGTSISVMLSRSRLTYEIHNQ